jgi:hypothetical protein
MEGAATLGVAGSAVRQAMLMDGDGAVNARIAAPCLCVASPPRRRNYLLMQA